MSAPDCVNVRDGFRARYLQVEGLLVLSGHTEVGSEIEVVLPLRGMSAVMDALATANTEGGIRSNDLPDVPHVLDIDDARIGIVPKVGLAMRLTLSDRRQVVALFRSRQTEPVLRQAAERMTTGLALAVQGSVA